VELYRFLNQQGILHKIEMQVAWPQGKKESEDTGTFSMLH